MSLIEAMARTPQQGYRGCSSFGLREVLRLAGMRPELLTHAKNCINESLLDLGLKDYFVEAISMDISGYEQPAFSVVIGSKKDPNRRTLSLFAEHA